jgi:hypothetical protein
MVKTAKKIINWAFEDNAGFFISEYPFSFDENKVTGYFIFKKYRAFGIPFREEIKLFLEKEKAQEYLDSIVNKN